MNNFMTPDPKFDKARQKANFEILELLNEYFTEYPEMRFGQAIVNLIGIEDGPFFAAEPQEILKLLKERV